MFSSSPEESRTELLLKRVELKDALEAAEASQRRRIRLGLGLLAIGVIALILGLTLDTRWLVYAVSAFLIPIFGFGFFLMAGQEVGRLEREVEAVDPESQLLESGEKPTNSP